MSHPADFVDASTRHWDDAERLFKEKCWANADYLYGLSAECGLKAVMIVLGLKTDACGSPEELEYRKHVHELWEPFMVWTAGASERAEYVARLRLLPDEPFQDWSHHNRYANRCHFNETDVMPHSKAAQTVRDMVQHAVIMRGNQP